MNVFEQVADIERRAAALGIPMQDILDAAKVNRSTWNRWKAKSFWPQSRKLAKVEQVIVRKEKAAC